MLIHSDIVTRRAAIRRSPKRNLRSKSQWVERCSRSRVSTDGGTELRWARNGHELFYREGDRRMVVQTSTDPLLIIGKPKLLFEGDFVRSPGTRANYDVTPDGRRFILLQEVR